MGNIAEKLNYLAETKKEIRKALEDKDIYVGDNDTFRAYADKIKAIRTGTPLPANILAGSRWKRLYPTYPLSEEILYFEYVEGSTQLKFEYTRRYSDDTFTTTKGDGSNRFVDLNSWYPNRISLITNYSSSVDYYWVREYDEDFGEYKLFLTNVSGTKLYVKIDKDIIRLQDKKVYENSIVTPDAGYDGLNKVTVYVEGIKPTGTLYIKENGNFDVKNYANANVEVEGKEDLTSELIEQNTALTELEAAVNNLPDAAPEPNLVLGEFTQNGTYSATDDNADGYSSVVVNVPIPEGYVKPEGHLEIKENVENYDVTNIKTVTVSVSGSGGGSLAFYEADIVTDEQGYNVLKLTSSVAHTENTYAVGQTEMNDTLYVVQA